MTFYSYDGYFTAADKIYLLNNELVTLPLSQIVLDPLPTSYTFGYLAKFDSSPTLPADLLTFAMPQFSLQSNTLSYAGDHVIEVDASFSSVVPADLSLQQAKASFNLHVRSYENSFEVADQAYLRNGVAKQFSVTPIVLNPADVSVIFDYKAVRQGELTLPTNFINFDPTTLKFIVQSDDQTLGNLHTFEVQADSTDALWAG